ncbi:metal ABC transporter permease [bacterium]|nr:metal ABC transporter permease [bacterium]
MTEFFEPFQYQFMWRGLLIAIFLGISGGLLGCTLVLRRMALMGDALAHSLLPGMGIAFLLFGSGIWSLFLGALVSGLLTALGSGIISRLTRLRDDAAFGALFVISFGLGIALISSARARVNVDLMHFLFGNILGVGSQDLWLAAGVSTLTLLAFALFYRDILIESFDPVFYRTAGLPHGAIHLGLLALIVVNLVAALQAMGIVLALGLFLLPAVTSYLWCERWGTMLAFSTVVAVVGSTTGLLLSYHLRVSSGPCVVITLGIVFFVSAFLSPKHGLLSKYRRPSRHRTEDDGTYCPEH